MMYREILKIWTKTGKHIDITGQIIDIVEKCRIKNGICHVFLSGTTAGFLMNENCPMLMGDFENLFEKLTPKDKLYQHPDNAHSHLRASMLQQSLSLPIANSKLLLGTWQKIILMEFDTSDREREIIVTVSL